MVMLTIQRFEAGGITLYFKRNTIIRKMMGRESLGGNGSMVVSVVSSKCGDLRHVGFTNTATYIKFLHETYKQVL